MAYAIVAACSFLAGMAALYFAFLIGLRWCDQQCGDVEI